MTRHAPASRTWQRCATLLLIVTLALASGCPDTTPVSTGRCEHAGESCRLANGTLGICSESLAAACPSPPCLACTSQH